MFKKVDKKTLKEQTDIVNDTIKYFKSKNITEANDLIKASTVRVAERIELKQSDYREKKRTQMETQNLRRYKETETRCKLLDKRLERGVGIEEETKNERTI